MPVPPISAISTERASPATATTIAPFSAAQGSANASRAKAAEKAEVHQQFEALILKQFVEAMLPKDADNVYGGGFAGDAWKSMLADKIAQEIAQRGTLGIAKALFPEDAAAATVARWREEASSGSLVLDRPLASGAAGPGPGPAETAHRKAQPASADHDNALHKALAKSVGVTLAANRSRS